MRINLGESEGIRVGSLLFDVILFGGLVGIVLFSCQFYSTLMDKKVIYLQKEIGELDKEISRHPQMKAELDKWSKNKDELDKKQSAIDSLATNRTGPVNMFKELSDSITQRIYFTYLEFLGDKFKIQGKAIDNMELSDFLIRMSASKTFSNVNLVRTQNAAEESIELVLFEIAGSIKR